MVSVTLSIPEDIRHKMEDFSEINWSGFIRKAIIDKTRELEWREKMKQQLKKEEDLNQWTLSLQNKTRTTRIKELKNKGLL